MRIITVGQVDYQQAWAWQKDLAAQRAANTIQDTLLVLAHPHTYTIGRSGSRDNLLLDKAVCRERGITVLDVDRGGDITYHGPGQLVAYPILDLGQPQADGRLLKADYVGYLRRLEDVQIATIAAFGLHGFREEGYTGVWTGSPPAKIAAIGVRVNAKGISTHGIALNIDPDLSYFAGIIPCGITDRPVTSMGRLLGADCPPWEAVQDVFIETFISMFQHKEQG
ncbi:MAG: lipoyl(octanoyl) transferase LipB [Anaerolineae bacterium]